ncbi:MAG: hypothetical protein AB7P04_03050 [Bacteriovoracia bacterium]
MKINHLGILVAAALVTTACDKTELDPLTGFEVKQAITFTDSKKKTVVLPVGPTTGQVQFATKKKNGEVQSGMLLKLGSGKKIEFNLGNQPLTIVKNLAGRDVVLGLENVRMNAGDTGQTVGLAFDVVARVNEDRRERRVVSCSYTISEYVCRYHPRYGRECYWVDVTRYGYQDVEDHYYGDRTQYTARLVDRDGGTAAMANYDVNGVMFSRTPLNACR